MADSSHLKYCESISNYKRRPTREVMVGNVGVGGANPIRIQSMTTSDTKDVKATVDQIIRLADYGCEIARITVQGMKEAHACEEIKNTLLKMGYTIPLVADIHFYPPAAMTVVEYVDKVRVNPGNFVDRRATFKTIEYDDIIYQKEIEKINEKFSPLVIKCKNLNRSMRIGTNHGSLSDRIMNRYGDTPKGMVESAIEFAKVCISHDYHNFMFSMKASNTQVMIEAYRLLVAEMYKLGWDYPLHLGVTEAGEGDDGRVRSAIGIGSLLLDGIGDTIRVSLTEDAWLEIDPCKRLVKMMENYQSEKPLANFEEKHRRIDIFEKRHSELTNGSFLHRDGSVLLKVTPQDIEDPDFFSAIGCGFKGIGGTLSKEIDTADALICESLPESVELLAKLNKLKEIGIGILSKETLPGFTPLLTIQEALNSGSVSKLANKFQLLSTLSKNSYALLVESSNVTDWEPIKSLTPNLIILSPRTHQFHTTRHFFDWCKEQNIKAPIILNFCYNCSAEDLVIFAPAENGSFFCDGLGDGICINSTHSLAWRRALSFNILQGSRMRTTKTEFISCPSCGRTLFDLQEVSRRIREKTSHLPGVKIAIMGCIVNGPGEMADADFGYVGSKTGKVDLYIEKTCVERDIDSSGADERLIQLIKNHGRWVEPEQVVTV